MNRKYYLYSFWEKINTPREIAAITGHSLKTIRWWKINKKILNLDVVLLLMIYNGFLSLDEFENYVEETVETFPRTY